MRCSESPNPDSSVEIATNHLLQHLEAKRPGCVQDARILDFGCGTGGVVRALRRRGFLAFGCDIALDQGAILKTGGDSYSPTPEEDVFRAMDSSYPLIPFPDGHFDIVVSNQVLEHVVDLQLAFRELRRVLKPGGCSLHFFPSRWDPLEVHVGVPLGTLFRNRPYLRFWARLGIRNQFQRSKSAQEVTALNYDYLRLHTFYPSQTDLQRMLMDSFPKHSFIDREIQKAAANRPGLILWKSLVLKALITLRLHKLYRPFWGRSLWLEG